MSLFKHTLFLIGLSLTITVSAQSIKDVRINEIQINNVDGFRDEYGRANAWIELYNKGYGKVNMAGCTLKVNGKSYQIPKGDPATIIPTRGYLVFFADGLSNRGTFHTNFTLDDTDFIELYDSDGKLIDAIRFNPADMTENVSYGWLVDHDGKEKLMLLPATTPANNNNTEDKISRSEIFRQADPTGAVLTITNIVVVSIALTLLFFIFKYMGNFHTRKFPMKKTDKTMATQTGEANLISGKKKTITNDELAVIAIALYKYTKSMHDYEDTTLTINKVSRAYSPWSSKIYGLRQTPNKKYR